jgi:hypothetical protein
MDEVEPEAAEKELLSETRLSPLCFPRFLGGPARFALVDVAGGLAFADVLSLAGRIHCGHR